VVRLCDREDVHQLVCSGKATIVSGQNLDRLFLDDHRIGLHIEHLYEVTGAVNLHSPEPPTIVSCPLGEGVLLPGAFYLGTTQERISLTGGLAASLHTRSRYARLGLEFLGSSNFIVPGFGTAGAAPIVFEITVRRQTSGMRSDASYCFLLLYDLTASRLTRNLRDYNARFPINHPLQTRGQKRS
jgi:hypothetical protein